MGLRSIARRVLIGVMKMVAYATLGNLSTTVKARLEQNWGWFRRETAVTVSAVTNFFVYPAVSALCCEPSARTLAIVVAAFYAVLEADARWDCMGSADGKAHCHNVAVRGLYNEYKAAGDFSDSYPGSLVGWALSLPYDICRAIKERGAQ